MARANIEAGKRLILPQTALNAVPITRTPWGGSRIPAIKASLPGSSPMPERVGESWEISTGNPYPSRLRDGWSDFDSGSTLEAVLSSKPALLGSKVTDAVGAHSPLLLKWLHAQDVLSLQVHPALGDSRLAPDKEGKPESWLILESEADGYLYLGFKDGFTREEIIQAFRSGSETEVIYRFRPEPGEYICVPPGCVHAIGPGVLLAEPQYCMPGKEGVTLRVSDWNRLYNESGERDPKGKARATHFDESIETIDWNLPRGDALRRKLCRVLQNGERFEPAKETGTPFPVQYLSQVGDSIYLDLVKETYSVVTVWSGTMTLTDGHEEVCLSAGETAFLSPHRDPLSVRLSPAGGGGESMGSGVGAVGAVGAAFFSIRL